MPSNANYTTVSSPTLSARLNTVLADIGQEIGELKLRGLAAVILGGGYGRGEGGVLHTSAGDALYNDLDFFVFTRKASPLARWRINRALAKLSRKWSETLKVAVDFGPAKNLSALRRVSNTLMFQELVHGWRPVWGDLRLEEFLPPMPANELPLIEGLRLMLNRGMGLRLASGELGKRHPAQGMALLLASSPASPTENSTFPMDEDFVVRNVHKAILGAGDALLISNHGYFWAATKRLAALEKLFQLYHYPEQYITLYKNALQFKFEPKPQLPPNPQEFWQEALAFWRFALLKIARCPQNATSTADLRSGLLLVTWRERSLTCLLRWFLYARCKRPFSELLAPPIVTLLGDLHAEFTAKRDPFSVASHSRLMRLWRHFN